MPQVKHAILLGLIYMSDFKMQFRIKLAHFREQKLFI
jgi:hypothetical protein